jgi:hypothetical protein
MASVIVYPYAPDRVSGSASVVWRSRSREAMRAVDIMTMDDVAIQISSQMASWTTDENYKIYAGYGNDCLPLFNFFFRIKISTETK